MNLLHKEGVAGSSPALGSEAPNAPPYVACDYIPIRAGAMSPFGSEKRSEPGPSLPP
jgi:hypothetical protein